MKSDIAYKHACASSLYNKINIGDVFSRLTVIEIMPPVEYTRKTGEKVYIPSVKCRCKCGNTKVVSISHLLNGFTHSCGCYLRERRIEVSTTHNMKHTRLYKIWIDMRQRCNNKNRNNYSYYGGRGIKVCDEWDGPDTTKSFMNFYKWAMENGYSDNLSIDRKDSNGDYEPNNCRWVTQLVQSNNTRQNRHIFDGIETLTWSQFCNKYSIPESFVISKKHNNWSDDAIVYAAKHQNLEIKKKRNEQMYYDNNGFVILIPKLNGGAN